ncbi:sigma-70 family RNA polymerase sigma factor [Actinotalea sp. K2]|uniref:RNA polymerase sigma factor n=1 Tax=Actinotalea sp. K2 TaxID=2939438 RepID=UPI0020171C7A|nr:sigma-70 family RNA polymerase sigma factor [Actinotalea sp. K2]MCL3860043.1 sigma-70 family RNA polymerase sigma factor [Actinotalea sp. K2]
MNRTAGGTTEEADVASTSLGGRAAAALESYRAGDPHLLAELVQEATPLLWHIVRGQGVDRDDAEDVVQEVWLAFVRSTSTIREPQALLKWLVVSARRAAWRTSGRRREDLRRTAPLPEDDRAVAVRSTEPPVDEPLLVAERDQTLWRRFLELPERCQQLLRFVAMADRPDYKAIAEVTGMQVTAVGVTRGRCLAKLRALLDADERWVEA